MQLKFYFLAFLTLIILSFSVSAQSCSVVGEINGSQYCSSSGSWANTKANGQACVDGYECSGTFCVEGVCANQQFPDELTANSNTLQELFNLFFNSTCNPDVDEDYKCAGSYAFLCGSQNTWEFKGQVPGQCGVSNPSTGGNNNNNGGSGSSSLPIIQITSPVNSIAYESTQISLQVYDSRRLAKFWSYSINNGPKTPFTPNTTITAIYGANSLTVYAKRSQSARESLKSIAFQVLIPTPQQTSVCGNGVCNSGENSNSCSADCGTPEILETNAGVCGNEMCEDDESSFICPSDCKPQNTRKFIWVALTLLIASTICLAVLIFVLIRANRKSKNSSTQISSAENYKSK